MRANVSAKRSLLKRCFSVAAMLGMYCLAMIAITGFAISTSTDALAKNGGRGGGRGGGGGMARGGRGGGGARGGGRGGRGGGMSRGRGGRGMGRGGGRGRGGWRGGIWFPWIGPGICHHPWTSARVWCNY